MSDPLGQESAALHRAEDFITAFNTIERELKRQVGIDDHEGFKHAARRFLEDHPWWQRDYEAMMGFADLRNVIVHDRFKRFAYLSIPTQEVVAEIQAVRERLLRPRTAGEEFRREVVTVEVQDSLVAVLEKVEAHDVTQFPAYDKGKFAGLVTSNGVVHWLSRKLTPDLTLVDFEEATVNDLLKQEEKRPNWGFIPRAMPVEEVIYAFQENPRLEAVLVTQDGREEQKLLGIATQWDIAKLRGVV